MSQTPNTAIAVIGIDIGKNSFHTSWVTMRAAPSCCVLLLSYRKRAPRLNALRCNCGRISLASVSIGSDNTASMTTVSLDQGSPRFSMVSCAVPRHQDAGGTIEVYVVGDPDRRRRGNGNDRTSEAARVTSKPPSAPAQPRRRVGRVEQRHRDVVGCLLGVPVAFVLSYGLQYRRSEPGDRRPKFCRPNDSKVSRTRELCVLKSTTPR